MKTAIPGICDSVGAVIENEKGEFLSVYRLVKPVGFGFPSYHTYDLRLNVPDSPGDALRKGLLRDFGISNLVMRQMKESRMVIVNCRRGHEMHFCHLYKILSYEGEPRALRPDKHKFVRFMSRERIREFIENKKNESDPAWKEFLLPTLGIL